MTREMVLRVRCNSCGNNVGETEAHIVKVEREGETRMLDLCMDCVTEFEHQFWTHGDVVGKAKRAKRAEDSPGIQNMRKNKEIREWAKLHYPGFTNRGKIPKAVRDAYDVAPPEQRAVAS